MCLLAVRPRMFVPVLLLSTMSFFVGGCAAQNGPPSFNSTKAFSILQKQCDFGPRPVGSSAHDKLRDYLVSELRKNTNSVKLQSFQHKTYNLSNIIARFGGSETPGILLCAHWDTRPIADQELEAADRKRPILGANDGASGVAALLELARMFKERPPDVPVTIVLFDGEDFGPTGKDMFLGSRHFAKTMDKSKYRYGILLDMVGDKELQIHREGNSQAHAASIADKVWKTAQKLGHGGIFSDELRYTIEDDHVPLIEAGLPCIDVIDFDYAYWHTLDDTVDKCSAKSLQVVGEIIAEVVYSERPGS